MKNFCAVSKAGVWAALRGAVMLVTAGCALPIGPDYAVPLSVTPPSQSGQVPYVAEYNLQQYVPVPVAGNRPVKLAASRGSLDVRVAWKDGSGGDITGSLAVFENGLEYQAEITLTAKNGYEFAGGIPFAYEEGMVRGQTCGDNGHPTRRTVHAEYLAAAGVSPSPSARMVDRTDLTGHIPAPAAGKAPVSLFQDSQYAGIVQWSAGGTPAEGPFEPLTAYEAAVTLIPVSGYTFSGLPANAFSHNGASSVSSGADGGAVAISFAATGTIAIENYNLQDYVPVPAAGDRAVKTVDRDELSVGVVWKDEVGTDITNSLDRFELGEVYQAEITLTAKTGYEFKTEFAYLAGANAPTGDNSNAGSRTLGVIYAPAGVPTVVTDTTLAPYIPRPVTDGVPISYFTASSGQYSGTVTWTKTEGGTHAGLFAAGTAYTATVSLHPAPGYTLDGFAGSFTHTGASSVYYNATDKTATVEFAETDKILINGPIDLTLYLPAPAAGARPATALAVPAGSPFTGGAVAWFLGNSPVNPPTFGTVAYKAKVPLRAAAGYTFKDSTGTVSFTHNRSKNNGTSFAFDINGGDPTQGTVTINFVMPALVPVSAGRNLRLYVPTPVTGGTPVTSFSTAQYSATVTWSPALGASFLPGTVYTAELFLTPSPGYTFSDGFTHGPGVTVDNSQLSANKARLMFAPTAKTLINGPINLDLYLPAPAAGAQPAAALAVPMGSPFTGGAVTWKKGNNNHTGAFAANTAYTATVTLIPAEGYTFDGGASSVTHSKSSGTDVEANGDNRTVTIDFVKTPAMMITDVHLDNFIPKPVAGATKVLSFATTGYTGIISWQNTGNTDDSALFVSGGKYTAEIKLYPSFGYAFDDSAFNDSSQVYEPNGVTGKTTVNGFLPEWLGISLAFDYVLP